MQSSSLERADWRWAFGLFLVTIIATAPGLSGLEFFRHTEADRTLIGWEMWERGDWIVPHLLGDEYLTKPPLFYQLLAVVFSIFGSVSEAAARSVSLLAGAALTAGMFALLRCCGLTREESAGAAIVFATTGLTLTQIGIAEMDMTYTALSALALLCGFLSVDSPPRLAWALAAHTLVAFAVLTKGPPILAFYGLGVGTFILWETWIRLPSERLGYARSNCVVQLLSVLVGCAIFLLWFVPFMQRESIQAFEGEFRNEIVQRFVQDPKAEHRARGLLFYALNIPVSFLPWTLVLIPWAFNKRRGVGSTASSGLVRATTFSVCVVVPSCILFSLASGKSGRYLFPLYPFLAVIAVWLMRSAALDRFSPIRRQLVSFPRALGLAVGLLLMFRLGQAVVYSPIRNRTMTVKPAVREILTVLPSGEPLYVIELFERWVLYYLKHDGHEPLRLTPSRARTLSSESPSDKTFLLLDAELESWRLDQLTAAGGNYRIVLTTTTSKDKFLVVQVPNSDLFRFNTRAHFPTDPSSPYPGISSLTSSMP